MDVAAEPTMLEGAFQSVLEKDVSHVAILGVGGAGCNIVSCIKEKGTANTATLALNSDAQQLNATKADKKILLGYDVANGVGCMGYPERGAKAALETAGAISKELVDSDMVFIAAGLGGGTGTGAAPVVAEIAKNQGAAAIGVATMPFQIERVRLAKSKEGLANLVDACDAVIVVENEKLVKAAGNLPLNRALPTGNQLLASFLMDAAEMAVKRTSVNGGGDLKAIMTERGVCTLGFGDGLGEKKVEDAVMSALSNHLLDVKNIKKARGALVHLECGEDARQEDLKKACNLVKKRISSKAKVSVGAKVNKGMYEEMQATVVLAGVDSPLLEGVFADSVSIMGKLKQFLRT